MKKGKRKRVLHKKMQNKKSGNGTQKKRVVRVREENTRTAQKKYNKEEIRKANSPSKSSEEFEKEMLGGTL